MPDDQSGVEKGGGGGGEYETSDDNNDIDLKIIHMYTPIHVHAHTCTRLYSQQWLVTTPHPHPASQSSHPPVAWIKRAAVSHFVGGVHVGHTLLRPKVLPLHGGAAIVGVDTNQLAVQGLLLGTRACDT